MTSIIFDLDGTLINSLPDVTNAANGLLTDYDLSPVSSTAVTAMVGMGEGVFIDRLISATGLPATTRAKVLADFIEHYKRAALNTVVFDGALDALAELRAAGHKLALCTNKPQAALTPTLISGGLESYFDVVVAGDTLPVRKPDPAPVHYILSELAVDTCIFVGDSEVDGETARRAKVPFLLFTEGIRSAAVDDIPHIAKFNDFSELAGLCAKYG